MSANWNEFAVIATRAMAGQNKKHLVTGGQPNAGFFPIEVCARQVFATNLAGLQRVPALIKHSPDTEIHTGAAAYAYFMRFYTGMLSRHQFEIHVSGQIRNAWTQHTTRFPNSGQLAPFVDAVFHDGSMLRSRLLDAHLRRPSRMNVAADLAQLSNEKKLLLICDDNTEGAVNCIAAIGHQKKTNPGVISITHPNSDKLNAIAHGIGLLPSHRAVTVPIDIVPIETALAKTLHRADVVFVDQPMSERASFDDIICQGWKARHLPGQNGRKGHLVHLQAPPTQAADAIGPWAALTRQDHNFISGTTLLHEQTRQLTIIQDVAKTAETAIAQLAIARLAGDRPIDMQFQCANCEVSLRLARRLLGQEQGGKLKTRRPATPETQQIPPQRFAKPATY